MDKVSKYRDGKPVWFIVKNKKNNIISFKLIKCINKIIYCKTVTYFSMIDRRIPGVIIDSYTSKRLAKDRFKECVKSTK